MDIKKAILKNPQLFKLLLKFYNYTIGFNKLKIKNNILSMEIAQLKKTKINIHGTGNIIKIGDLSRLNNCSINIYGNNNLIDISSGVLMNQVEFHIEDDYNKIIIGEKTSIQGKTHLAAIESTSIVIGKDCMFSSDIHFTTGDSHSIINLDGNRINKSEDITIGNHVWIGTKVTCLKGVIVPDNCIVGASTLLNKKYNQKKCIIAGNPCKVVSTDKDWLRKRI